ncbi:uncharacterized domain 1-containing protein [Alteribacillus persepolensis]|uniref:Uncharacterized domain 1-containing protein n=1 Tax=Alteribacillus persepolensis TaxID=568899 RepID=A0A1G7YBZ0_9BACI|nr:PaaI family thioesterase [Alteribacillus persepolensis]SDG93934.1 uncharacterized domain 1-containing protein [Alteribacillus persepolensis]
MANEELQQRYHAFLEEATEEERNILEETILSLEGKRQGKYLSYMDSWLQAARSWKDEETYEITVRLHKGMDNPMSMVHGGVTATVLDTTMGEVANAATPEGFFTVTLELKINYLKPGNGDSMRCEGKMISKSRRTVTTEGRVYNEKDEIIAYGSATFYVIPVTDNKLPTS